MTDLSSFLRSNAVAVLLLVSGVTAFAESEGRALRERQQALQDFDRATAVLAKSPEDKDALVLQGTAATTLGARTLAYSALNRLEALAPRDPRLAPARERIEALDTEAFDVLDGLINESATALAKQQVREAAELLRMAELLLPDLRGKDYDRTTLRVIRGDTLVEAEQFALAQADYEQARGADGAPTAEARVALGRLFVRWGKPDEALPQLATLSSDDGAHFIFARYWTAKALAARHAKARSFPDAARAYQLFAELAEADPNDEDYARERDAVRDSLTDKERAQLRPTATMELVEAESLRQAGKLAESRRKLDRLLLRHPRFAEGYAARARVASDPAAATRDRGAATLLENPGEVPEEKSSASALELAERAVKNRPYASDSYLQRARALLAEKKPELVDRAMTDARAAISWDAYDPQARVVLAEALVAQAKKLNFAAFAERDRFLTEASVVADRAVALAPEDVPLLLWRGDFAAASGPVITRRASQAMRFYTQALRLDPQSTELLLRRARAATESQREVEAIVDYQDVLRLSPDLHVARFELGLCQLVTSRFDDAVASFDRLQTAYPLETNAPAPEGLEVAQLGVIARAARGENQLTRARELLRQGEWSESASNLLWNLRHRTPHSPELDRLEALRSSPKS